MLKLNIKVSLAEIQFIQLNKFTDSWMASNTTGGPAVMLSGLHKAVELAGGGSVINRSSLSSYLMGAFDKPAASICSLV